MIANASSGIADVRLWLLDLVTHTDWKGGFPELPPAETRTIGTHVDQVVRVVMEDEYNLPPCFRSRTSGCARSAGGTSSDTQAPGTARLTFIRMPGGHGSGTQVNPLSSRGAELGDGDITSATPGRLWPIGEACLAHALDALESEWGVAPQAQGRRLPRTLRTSWSATPGSGCTTPAGPIAASCSTTARRATPRRSRSWPTGGGCAVRRPSRASTSSGTTGASTPSSSTGSTRCC